jgi:hypothetical protein
VDDVRQLSLERSDETAVPAITVVSPAAARRAGHAAAERPAAACVLALAALCGWTVYKGFISGFYTSEIYFWISTYAHGLVRRGLAGTMLAPLLQHSGLTVLKTVALAINRAGLGLIVMILLLAVARQRRHWAATWALACVFASAPFLSQTALLVGFPDGLIALMVAALIAAAWRGPPVLVLAVSMVAALFHEFVPIVALPGVCLAACLRPRMGVAARAAMVASVLAVIVWAWAAGHAPPEAVATLTQRLIALGETPAEALHQARWRLTQSTSDDFAMLSQLWRWWWLNGLMGLAYAATPALVLCLLGYPRLLAARSRAAADWHPAWRRAGLAALYAASCFSPLAILPIAVDLSRLAGFTALTTVVTLFALPPAKLPRGGRAMAACTVAFFVLLPAYNLHLPNAYAARLRLLSPVCPPCGRAFVDALNFYNRGQSQEVRNEALTDPAYQNGPL